MRRHISAIAAVWLVFGGATPAQVAVWEDVTVDYGACEAQLKALLRLDIDCTINAQGGNGTLESIPAILRPVLRRLACLLPLRFPKKDIYDRWIQKGIVEVPAMTATCRLSVPGMNTSEFSSSLELRCQKAGDAWSCAPKMYGTTALGIIGTQLENFVNTNTEIRRQIERAVAGLGQ